MSRAPEPAAVEPASSGLIRTAIAIALGAAALRLIPLQFLHPLQWDELEFFRATQWIGGGRVPFRDFWEHHTPLAWYLFAPVTWLARGDGVGAVIVMRWAQLPVWIATFWMLNLWMRGRAIDPFGRWAAIGLALASSFFMIAAVEYRVDTVGCFLVVAGFLLAQRGAHFWSGVVFCLAVFANLRLGPMVAVAMIGLAIRNGRRAGRMFAGGLGALAAAVAWLAANGSMLQMWRQVFVENRLGDAYAMRIGGSLAHRLLSPFGLRLLASDRIFDPAGIDPGAIAILLLGLAGLVAVLRSWRAEGEMLVIAATLLAGLFFIGTMKFIYNYHFEIVVLLLVPLAAAGIAKVRRREAVVAVLAAAFTVSVFASVFRGKELDRAYQDRIMREVHARTGPGDEVWSGAAWAIRREPAYRFWFLPDLARQLVLNRHADRLSFRRAPGAIIADHNALVWMTQVQPELLPYVTTHYLPLWRDLLVPAMNVRLLPGAVAEWIVPRTATYRVYVSTPLARHPWFSEPVRAIAYKGDGASRLTAGFGEAGPDARVRWTTDRVSAAVAGRVSLREGQIVTARSDAAEPLAVFLVPTEDRVFFRQPPPGVSIDAESPRVTHVPQIGVELAP